MKARVYFWTLVVLLLLVALLLLSSLLGLGGMPTGFVVVQESTHVTDVVLVLLTILSLALAVFGAHYIHEAARKTKI